MNTTTTSLAPANSMREQWGRFLAFLKRPTLPDRAAPFRTDSLRVVLQMLGLDVLAMIVLLSIAGAVMAAGLTLPQTAIAGVELEARLLFAVVIGAPVIEEILFRGWLSGRPGHVFGLLVAVATTALGSVILSATGFSFGGEGPTSGLAAIGLATAIGIATGLFTVFALRRREAMEWFQRLFPFLFWISTLAFSLVHLLNFPVEDMAMALPLVLPQFATGTILAYLRVNYGLWASMLLHALHNGAFISMVMLASQAS